MVYLIYACGVCKYICGKDILLTIVSIYCEFKIVVAHWDFSVVSWNLGLFVTNSALKGIGFQLEWP